jgi:hypothetical protein
MSEKLTIQKVIEAYAMGTIKGGVGQTILALPFGPRTIASVLAEAIKLDLIKHNGNPYGGWLTDAALSQLDDGVKRQYKAALNRRGRFLGAG